jgi:hypothetical protein
MSSSETEAGTAKISLQICPGCGRIAPTARDACEVCETGLEQPLTAPELPEGAYAVAVHCEFQCRQCGKLAPLNHLDIDGSVVCAHCQLDQAFDVGAWKEALRLAHGVGDLAGPTAEGRHPHPRYSIAGANPGTVIGKRDTLLRSTQNSTHVDDGVRTTRSLRLEASPGYPLCPACRVPLDVTLEKETSTTRCPRCGDRATYETPPSARKLHHGLRGVQAEDHRRDHEDVRLDIRAGGGSVAVACPGCGATMAAHGETKVVVCEFCQTVSRIPDKVLQETFHITPEKETWWLWFRGPSWPRGCVEKQISIPGWKNHNRGNAREIEKAPTVATSWVPRWLIGGVVVGGILLVTLLALAATGMFETIAQEFLIVSP